MEVEELLAKIATLPKDDVLDLMSTLSARERAGQHDQIKEIVDSHKSYVQKCYYKEVKPHFGLIFPVKLYIKVVSERSFLSNEITVLSFHEHPWYWFSYNAHKDVQPGDYYLGRFDFSGIKAYSIDVSELEQLHEISLDEYNEAMDKYVKELQNMEWIPDHSR